MNLFSGKGRATRKDFISCSITYILSAIAVLKVIDKLDLSDYYTPGSFDPFALWAFAPLPISVLFAGGLAAGTLLIWLQITNSIRRLHDMGMEGGPAFLLLIPIINLIVFFYLLVSPPSDGENRFGNDPRDILLLSEHVNTQTLQSDNAL